LGRVDSKDLKPARRFSDESFNGLQITTDLQRAPAFLINLWPLTLCDDGEFFVSLNRFSSHPNIG
jgi:hypothetical protein